MLVQDLMTTEIVSCDIGVSLQEAVERMLEHRVGCVIVTQDGEPHGIVTETDVLEAGATTSRQFSELSLDEVVSAPLITVDRGATVRTAVNRMKEHDVKKLPVFDGLELVGILTRTDIVFHYNDFIREAHDLDQGRGRWEEQQ